MPNPFADWDSWTADRVSTRAAALSAAMKEAGLPEAVPGLAELQGQGRFFACAPYGTCWEPTDGWAPKAAQTARLGQSMDRGLSQDGGAWQQPVAAYASARAPGKPWGGPRLVRAAYAPQYGNYETTALNPYGEDDDLAFFPCAPGLFPYGAGLSGLSFGAGAFYPQSYYGQYQWAVCHAGSWVQQGRRYAWVASTTKRYHGPFRWVKYGGKEGFVPIHPKDVAGKPPLNLEHGVFAVAPGKLGGSGGPGELERLAYNPATPVKVLGSAPRAFREDTLARLQPAGTPRLEGHVLGSAATSRVSNESSAFARGTAVPIQFDHKAGSFAVATSSTAGSRGGSMEHFGGNAAGGRAGLAGGSTGHSGISGAGGYAGNSGSHVSAAVSGGAGGVGRSGGSGSSGGGGHR